MTSNFNKWSPAIVLVFATLLSGCAAQPQSVVGCLNNPTNCLINADTQKVAQFNVPVGQATVSRNNLTGMGIISEYNSAGQYESLSLGRVSNIHVSPAYNLPGQTDVAISAATPGCDHQVFLFGNSYNHGVNVAIPQCGPFKIDPEPNGLMAIQENVADPKVFFFRNFMLSPPRYIPSLATYTYPTLGHAVAHQGPMVQPAAAPINHQVTTMQASARPAPAPVPARTATPRPISVAVPTYNMSGEVNQANVGAPMSAPAIPQLNLIGN